VEAGSDAALIKLNGAFATTTPNTKASFLFQAVEMAARAVLTAWGRPAAGPKVWSALFDRLSPRLEPEVLVWARQAKDRDPELVVDLLVPARDHVRSILLLIAAAPPPNWQARPAPLDWAEIPPKDSAFLTDAAHRAAVFAPGSELWLFGSRATGEAGDESDYDVRLIVPDRTPDKARALATGELWQAAKDHGVTIDHASLPRSEFDNPTLGDVLIVYEVRSYGLRVPTGC
jgi:hypothetical protein